MKTQKVHQMYSFVMLWFGGIICTHKSSSGGRYWEARTITDSRSMTIPELINYLFWWTIVSVIRIGILIIVNTVPSSLLNAAMMKNFEGDRIKVTTLEEAKKRGQGAYDKTKFDCEIVVKDLTEFFQRILEDDFVAIGETYMVSGYTFFVCCLSHTLNRFNLKSCAQHKKKDGLYECDHVDDFIACLANGWKKRYRIIKFYYNAREQLTLATNNQTRKKSVDVAEMHYNLGNDL